MEGVKFGIRIWERFICCISVSCFVRICEEWFNMERVLRYRVVLYVVFFLGGVFLKY